MARDKDLYPDLDNALNDAYRRNVEIGVAQPPEISDLDSVTLGAVEKPEPPLPDEFMGIKFSAQRGEVIIPTQNLTISLPEDPMTVNGRYFGFEVDSARLTAAINKANGQTHSWNPITSLSLSLSEAHYPLPNQVPTDDIYNDKDASLKITLPKVVEYSDTGTADLLEQLESSINLQIETGLMHKVARVVRGERAVNSLKGVLFTLSPVSGVSVGLETSQEIPIRVMEGVVTGVGILALAMATAYAYQRNFDSKTLKWAKKRVGDKDKWYRQQTIDEETFSGPLIKVVPSPWTPAD